MSRDMLVFAFLLALFSGVLWQLIRFIKIQIFKVFKL